MTVFLTIFKFDPMLYDPTIVRESLNTIHQRDKSFKFSIIDKGNEVVLIVFSRSKKLAEKRGEWIKKNLLCNEVDYKIREV